MWIQIECEEVLTVFLEWMAIETLIKVDIIYVPILSKMIHQSNSWEACPE